MTSKVIKNAVIYTGESVIAEGFVRFDKEVTEVGPMTSYQEQANEEVIDAKGQKLVPGFIDVHTHGGYSFDVMDADPEKLKKQMHKMIGEGLTTIFPTTMTQSNENIEKALRVIDEVAKEVPVIGGIHLEGPFVSPVFKGAQPEEYITEPDLELFKKWYKASGERIKLVTYAPEHSTSPAFEDLCIELGVVPSVGHSNACRAQLIHSKASHATHMYNACRPLHHREPGVVGHVMLEKNIQAELIVDGIHVHPDMIKLAYNVKGSEHINIITDSMRAKGMPDGDYELGGQKVYVKDRQARLEDGTLAGSVLKYDDAFRNMIKFAGCTMEEAVLMSSVNQAKEFKLDKKGGIAVGKDADFNLLNDALEIQATYSFGEKHIN
ncbi:N-acetylglucosamine-6-phosphate deacetylase [Listeria weihenstephanensis FSL R9-0317]|uniref:N-acetylglucosamine-6-phosphate deacetylase n=1 Tax=Listeria weihenstephanensis TaxID=1006155 RepID=A0A1S7FTM1_9LIST|nr:N-acetylglucosamine-6-phosphate deacetylase [Listeria weihenstephanensis]AQY50685.1 N-acetylglucosamine-6-phosphate deacetylase [Listeria weihenstephanensis]EUJ36230.1 N-acetylglucosamine-6-phosphate deacetylase [Listeria weihenstephanensis FSL R9-0317]MBC1499569.1 N-acetylglucosamine-6-phosphate deacetylase [Listeria weihenstephanensis]